MKWQRNCALQGLLLNFSEVFEFVGFETADLDSTSYTTADNQSESDIGVSSVNTSDLSDFSNEDQPVDTLVWYKGVGSCRFV